MSSSDDHDARLYGSLHYGVVTANDDPKMIGRVKARIPGLIEPETRWMFPLGTAGGGDKNMGGFFVPKVGSEVGVFFNQGDPDFPFYVCGHWGAPGGVSDAPSFITEQSDVTAATAPLLSGFEMDRFVFYFDNRPGKESFQIRDKVSGDGIAYDSTTRVMRMKAMTAIKLEAMGAIEIDALAVTIAGRPVTPGSNPI